jgi:hypothetical protein
LSFALAPATTLFARSQNGAAHYADGEESKIHDRGRQLLSCVQERRQGQGDRLPIVHAHDDQDEQNGDQENGFEQQFEIHKSSGPNLGDREPERNPCEAIDAMGLASFQTPTNLGAQG